MEKMHQILKYLLGDDCGNSCLLVVTVANLHHQRMLLVDDRWQSVTNQQCLFGKSVADLLASGVISFRLKPFFKTSP